jgi:RpiB/LacA/LacB family sugar-phosphate isomerase
LLDHLTRAGHLLNIVISCGGESCDYPESAFRVAQAVQRGEADRGILLCGSGIGMAVAANKVDGVRAVLVHDLEEAEMSRRHNDTNVACLAADRTPPDQLTDLVDKWLDTQFDGGRHARRVAKLQAIERGEDPAAVTVEG